MRSSVLAGVYKLSADVLPVASAHLPVLRIRDYSPEQVTVYQCEYVNSVCGTPKLTEPDVYNQYMLHRSNDVHAKDVDGKSAGARPSLELTEMLGGDRLMCTSVLFTKSAKIGGE